MPMLMIGTDIQSFRYKDSVRVQDDNILEFDIKLSYTNSLKMLEIVAENDEFQFSTSLKTIYNENIESEKIQRQINKLIVYKYKLAKELSSQF